MPLIPTIDKAFQKNLVAVLNRDAYSLYFSFKTSSQRVFNFLLHVHCLHTRFDINIIYNSMDAGELSNVAFRGLFLKMPIDVTR